MVNFSPTNAANMIIIIVLITGWTISLGMPYFVDCKSADVWSKKVYAQMKDALKSLKMTPTLLWHY